MPQPNDSRYFTNSVIAEMPMCVRAHPMSPVQQSMWVAEQIAPGGSSLHMTDAFELRGTISETALRAAITMVVDRHETLRTTFALVNAEPVQFVDQGAPVNLEIVDISGVSADRAVPESGDLVREVAERPYDLTCGPLLRVRLIRFDSHHSYLVVGVHHIIADDWSFGILYRELSNSYRCAIKGDRLKLDELPIQYIDYACWQRDRLNGQAGRLQIDYWKRQMRQPPHPLQLKSAGDRRGRMWNRAYNISFVLPGGLVARLSDLGRRFDASLFMICLATFQTVLARFASKPDIAVVTPINVRSRADLDDVIGLFVNAVPLRLDTTDDPTFMQVVARSQDAVLGALAHPELPLDQISTVARIERVYGMAPIAQAAFSLVYATRVAAPSFEDIMVRPLPVHASTATFDLGLELCAGVDRLDGRLLCREDAIDRTLAVRIVAAVSRCLDAVTRDWAKRVSALPSHCH